MMDRDRSKKLLSDSKVPVAFAKAPPPPELAMPEPPKRVRRKRRHKAKGVRYLPVREAILLIFVVAGSFIVGLFGFSTVHRGWNRWRETRLLKQSAELLHQGNAEAAEQAALEVVALDPNSLAACRVLAEATEKENRSETVAWRGQLARFEPSLDNQLNLASAALRFGQLDVARVALENVAPADRDRAAYQVVAGWLARGQGNVAEEERHFAAAVAKEPRNDTYIFNLAVLQIQSPDSEKNAAARTQLERLSKVAQFRTPALRALLENAVRQSQMSAAESLAQDLQMSQEVTFSDYLLCLDLYRKLNPKKFGALLDKVKPVAARRGSDLAQLIEWMNENALASEALRWSEKLPSEMTNRPPVVMAIAESLTQVRNWSRLKRWTRSGSWDVADYLRLAYQSYAVRQSRRAAGDAEAESLWDDAEHDAGDDPEREVGLARLASKWKLDKEAESLWQRVAVVPAARREALEALYKIYRQAEDLPNLRLIAQRLQESSPDEIGLAADAARLALLLDHNTAEGRQLAQETYEKAPNDTAAAVTYAFALYVIGRTQSGIEILKKLSPEQLRDPHAAVYAALLFDDDNQVASADDFIKLARKGPLFPEEKRLLEEIAARRQTASATPAPSP